MTQSTAPLPPRLAEIVADFEWSEGREKIELLLAYSEEMPPLPEWLQESHAQMDEVPECMTPVFVYAELRDGGMHFYFDIPPESPTVRGFAALLAQGLAGATPEEVLRVPMDFFYQMGLQHVLSFQRINGITAILTHLKQLAVKELEKQI